jgi:hypothetical protein
VVTHKKISQYLLAFFRSHKMQFLVRAMSLEQTRFRGRSVLQQPSSTLPQNLANLAAESKSRILERGLQELCLNMSQCVSLISHKPLQKSPFLPQNDQFGGFFPAKPQASLENTYKSSRGCKSHTPLTACKAALTRPLLNLG